MLSLLQNIFKVFVKYCASGQPFDEVVAYDSIRAHVAKIDQLEEAEDVVTAIIDLFKDLLNSILDAYRQAIEGYFEFLQFDALEFECHQPQSKVGIRNGQIFSACLHFHFIILTLLSGVGSCRLPQAKKPKSDHRNHRRPSQTKSQQHCGC
jgi:hypothetical protein